METEATELLFDSSESHSDNEESGHDATVEYLGADDHHEDFAVALRADTLGYIGNYPVTNSLVTSVVGSLILIAFVFILSFRFRAIPGRSQSLLEIMVEQGYEYTQSILEDEKVAKKTFPLIASLFVFIVFFNLVKFIPGAESLQYNGYVFFKPLHSDLNMTLALGITAFIFIQVMGIFMLGLLKYATKFINIKKPLTIPLGLIELVSEAAKLVSLSFRLFGNILVGGILLLLVSHAFHFVAPVPVMLFEIFVAFLQAGIFALLTLIYVKLAISEPH